MVAIDVRMETLEKDRASQFTLFDDDLVEKASYFMWCKTFV